MEVEPSVIPVAGMVGMEVFWLEAAAAEVLIPLAMAAMAETVASGEVVVAADTEELAPVEMGAPVLAGEAGLAQVAPAAPASS